MLKLSFYNSSTSWGGLEMNMVKLACWMRDRGHEIHVYVVAQSPAAIEAAASGLTVITVRRQYKYGDVGAALKFSRMLKERNHDHVMFFQNYDLSLAANLKLVGRRTLRTVYLQQMGIGVNKRDVLHSWRYNQLNAWITPLQSLRDEILQRTHFSPQKIHVIPLCVEIPAAQQQRTKELSREHLQLPQDVTLLGIMGRLDPAKGQDFVIRCVAEMKKRGIIRHLLVVGQSTVGLHAEYETYLRNLAQECDVQELVHFRPFTRDIAEFYAAIDLFVMATRSETYGMVTLEAMIHGCAVIGTNSGGTPELLSHGQRGALYTVDDVEDCIRAVNAWFDRTSDDRVSHVHTVQKEVRREYMHTRMCSKIETLFTIISIDS